MNDRNEENPQKRRSWLVAFVIGAIAGVAGYVAVRLVL
jgi:hypothetical protein